MEKKKKRKGECGIGIQQAINQVNSTEQKVQKQTHGSGQVNFNKGAKETQ